MIEYGLSIVDWFFLLMLINGCLIIYVMVNRYNVFVVFLFFGCCEIYKVRYFKVYREIL